MRTHNYPLLSSQKLSLGGCQNDAPFFKDEVLIFKTIFFAPRAKANVFHIEIKRINTLMVSEGFRVIAFLKESRWSSAHPAMKMQKFIPILIREPI